MQTKTKPRSLSVIAREIQQAWPEPHFSAKPYLHAMRGLSSVDDDFGYDTGRDIVLRFLGNAKTWRGDDARRIKTELRGML